MGRLNLNFYNLGRNILDSTRKIGHKVRGVSETNEYHNVTYATTMLHTVYMESRHTNPKTNGKHINV